MSPMKFTSLCLCAAVNIGVFYTPSTLSSTDEDSNNQGNYGYRLTTHGHRHTAVLHPEGPSLTWSFCSPSGAIGGITLFRDQAKTIANTLHGIASAWGLQAKGHTIATYHPTFDSKDKSTPKIGRIFWDCNKTHTLYLPNGRTIRSLMIPPDMIVDIANALEEVTKPDSTKPKKCGFQPAAQGDFHAAKVSAKEMSEYVANRLTHDDLKCFDDWSSHFTTTWIVLPDDWNLRSQGKMGSE